MMTRSRVMAYSIKPERLRIKKKKACCSLILTFLSGAA